MTNENSLLFMQWVCGLHGQTAFLIALLMKSKHAHTSLAQTKPHYVHTQNEIPHTGNINSWLGEGRGNWICRNIKTHTCTHTRTHTPAPCSYLPFPLGVQVPGEAGVSGTQTGHTQPTQPAPSPLAPSIACWLLHTTGSPASSPNTWRGELSCPHMVSCERPCLHLNEIHSVSHSS